MSLDRVDLYVPVWKSRSWYVNQDLLAIKIIVNREKSNLLKKTILVKKFKHKKHLKWLNTVQHPDLTIINIFYIFSTF